MKEINKYYSIVFMHNLIRHFVFFFFPLYFIELGFSGFQTGLLIGMHTITGLLFSFQAGMNSDRIKQRLVLAIGALLFAFFCLGLFFFDNFLILIIVFTIGGLANIIITLTGDALIMKASTSKKRGMQMGKMWIFKISPFIIGMIFGAWIISMYGFDSVFILSAAFVIIILLIILIMKDARVYQNNVKDYFNDFNNKKVIAFCMIIFIFSLHYGAEQTSYTPFLKQAFNFGFMQTSYYMAFVVVFLLMGAYVAGKLIDKGKDTLKILSFGMLVSGIGGILFAVTNNYMISLLWRSIHEIGDGIFAVTMSVGVISLFKKRRIGGNQGIIHATIIISTFVSSLIFGPIGFKIGYNMPHIIGGALSILAYVMIAFFIRFHKR